MTRAQKGANHEDRTAEGTPVAAEARRRVDDGRRGIDGAGQALCEVLGDRERAVYRGSLVPGRGTGRDAGRWPGHDADDARLRPGEEAVRGHVARLHDDPPLELRR